jgi:signal transduction histidine kinase
MRQSRVLIFLFFCYSSFSQGQAIQEAGHLEELRSYRNKAEDFRARSLNRFGLDQLQQYDNSLDALYALEKADTLKTINTSFANSSAAMQAELADLKNSRQTFLTSKSSFDSSYNKLLSKAAVLVLLLTAVFITTIVIWQRRLMNELRETEIFDIKLQNAQYLSSGGEHLIASARENLPVLKKMKTYLREINTQAEQFQHAISPETKNGSWKDIMMITKKINQQVLTEETKNEAIVDFAENVSEEKISADINQVCMHYFELVKEGFKSDDDQPLIHASTDLEKNLPRIKIIPAAIGHLLLHVLTNAMQSVQAKAGKNIKGYEPKVALSTRILPRFLQIRVHDNGDGIEDKYISRIRDAFFTMKKEEDAGLGLYVSNLIMKNHQGELKIESDRNRGTDVYLKFYIN